MANSRRTRAYRGRSGRASGSGALIDTVRNTFRELTRRGERPSGRRRRRRARR
jgi:hypothetical protein